ncbi:MAG: hypothetical protein NC218_06185 [Acetobacter sp.]|nr:hypothetical protein [Acetobacter sp.]
MKINEQGRSMIEMLGVLAVVGILSVSGISSFSTAMEKYRMNQSLIQIKSLLDVVYVYARQWRIKPAGNDKITLIPYIKAIDSVPEGMQEIKGITANDMLLKNSYESYIRVYINGSKYYHQTMFTINGTTAWEANIEAINKKNLITYCAQILESIQQIYRESPKAFCYIYFRCRPNGFPVTNLTEKQYNFQTMNIGEISSLCTQYITDKGGFFIQACFNNTN